MQCKRAIHCFTLSLSGSDSRRSNRWRNDNDATMVIKVSRRDDGDHDGASKIETQAQDDDGHIISLILITCDVYPLWILSCFD